MFLRMLLRVLLCMLSSALSQVLLRMLSLGLVQLLGLRSVLGSQFPASFDFLLIVVDDSNLSWPGLLVQVFVDVADSSGVLLLVVACTFSSTSTFSSCSFFTSGGSLICIYCISHSSNCGSNFSSVFNGSFSN